MNTVIEGKHHTYFMYSQVVKGEELLKRPPPSCCASKIICHQDEEKWQLKIHRVQLWLWNRSPLPKCRLQGV
jgi:hypothetical protein